MGRKSKLTPENAENVCKAVRIGLQMRAVAAAAGVDLATIYNWLKRGEKAKSGIYFEFFQQYKRAQGEAQFRIIGLINKHALDDWRAAAWIAERRWPADWSKSVQDAKILEQDQQAGQWNSYTINIQIVDPNDDDKSEA